MPALLPLSERHSLPINDAGVQFARRHLANVPRPLQMAADAVRAWAQRQGVEVQPDAVDVVTLHYRLHTDFTYHAVVVQRMSLTEALLRNWQGESAEDLLGTLFRRPWAGELPPGPIRLVERLEPLGLFDNARPYSVFNGLFQRTSPLRYDASTHLALDAQGLQTFIWETDFHRPYTAALHQFWTRHYDDYRLACKLGLLAACNRQVKEGSLNDAARRIVWRAAGLLDTGAPVQAAFLNVYGYRASDILCLTEHGGAVVLYVPGNSSPLHAFANAAAMQDWFAMQCRDPARRAVLQGHFDLADRHDGLEFCGVDSALEGLGVYPAWHRLPPARSGFTLDGRWSPREYVNYKPSQFSPTLHGDLFKALADRQRARSYADADTLIVRDSQITRDRWRTCLSNSLNLIGPVALLVPELAPLFAVVGMAEFGLGLEQAVHATTQIQQAQGVGTCVFGLLNAIPLAEDALSTVTLLRVERDAFVFPSLVNDRWGYPLSPINPPHWPDADVAPYFSVPNIVEPLDAAEPATAAGVTRLCSFDGHADRLEASLGGTTVELVYDLQADAFIREADVNEVAPTYFIARSGSHDLQPIDIARREVTHSMREATLRALGIDVPVPIELPEVDQDAATQIPRRITYLWVGDREMPPRLMDNLARNHRLLKHSSYDVRLLLSEAQPGVYARNAEGLAARAPGLDVLPLEQQAAFRLFQRGPYYAHYQAALDGNGGVAQNFASAADILRYRILFEDGGLYMDVDDAVLQPGEYPFSVLGEAAGEPGLAIDQLPLLATPDGLLLAPPVSNERLGMHCLYNTSFIGSHPGNLTLDAISDEIQARFAAGTTLYRHRPDLVSEPESFYRYAKQLSALTGPQVFNDVVDQRLPELYRLRQVINLRSLQAMNVLPFIDQARLRALMRARLPLNRLARPGSFHSWARP